VTVGLPREMHRHLHSRRFNAARVQCSVVCSIARCTKRFHAIHGAINGA
jgi:hypothetical protein